MIYLHNDNIYKYIYSTLDIFTIIFLGTDLKITHDISPCYFSCIAASSLPSSSYSNWPRHPFPGFYSYLPLVDLLNWVRAAIKITAVE